MQDGDSSEDVPAEGLAYAFDVVKLAARLAAASAGILCVSFLVAAVVLGILLGGWSYWIAAGEEAWRGWTAFSFGIVCALLAAGLLATRLAILYTVSKLVRKAAVGEEILKHLLAACGVSGDPGATDAGPFEAIKGPIAEARAQLESTGLGSELHGLPVRELKSRVQVVISRSVDHKLLAQPPLKWIAGGVRRVLVWAVVRIVVKNAVDSKAAVQCVDLARLRASLAVNLDEMIIDQINRGRVRFIWQICVLATGISISIAGLIRAIP